LSVSTEETKLILQFLENNIISILTFITVLVCLVIILLRGTDKTFPKFKKVKVGPGSIEVERETKDENKSEERRETCESHGRRKTDVCHTHCEITEALTEVTKALEDLKNVDKKLVEHDEEVWIMILEDRFYSPFRTKSVRMVSGLTYLWWGLNGDVKADVLIFKKENPEVYKDVITCRPELQLGKYAEGRKPENI